MNSAKRLERLQKWNEERLPALTTQLFDRVMSRAGLDRPLPAAILEVNRRLREAQERRK